MHVRKSKVALAATLVAAGIVGLSGRWRRYEIAESSMEPELSAGDYLIAEAIDNGIQRGDIVVVPHPEIGGFELIKRVIGLPGEFINLSNGYVHIDGIALAEPWAKGPTRPDGDWALGPTEVFVLGDNRPISAADSRTIGPVEASTIHWRAAARYWPPRRAGHLSRRPFYQ